MGEKKDPAGGYDATPLPSSTGGHTVKFTFHRADNLPISDLDTLASDPYLLCILTTDIPQRHKEDGPLKLRTPTMRRTVEPVWNASWIVANVPSSGFKLKIKVMDEDPGNHDDRLGTVRLEYQHISESIDAIKEKPFPIMRKSASIRAYGLRMCASLVTQKRARGDLYLSMEVLGKTEGRGGKTYTLGPNAWSSHYSPLFGRLAGTKEKGQDGIERAQFQANQIQLSGPVPDELYHRYVEFKGFVKGMFKGLGLRGRALHSLLMHQHARIYLYDRDTEYGCYEKPSEDLALRFLRMVHFDEGARIFTYVVMLDGGFRFTETGKEFGIDLLSKHTMHSAVSQYIACSGEFLIRRVKSRAEREKPLQEQDAHPFDSHLSNGPPNDKPPEDVKLYELVIDNDSGTYRPKGDLLPLLTKFLEQNLVGLKIISKECTDDSWQDFKQKQRQRKKKEGDRRIYMQGNLSSGSLSSSDASDLAARVQEENNEEHGVLKEAESKMKSAVEKLKDPKTGVMEWAEKIGN